MALPVSTKLQGGQLVRLTFDVNKSLLYADDPLVVARQLYERMGGTSVYPVSQGEVQGRAVVMDVRIDQGRTPTVSDLMAELSAITRAGELRAVDLVATAGAPGPSTQQRTTDRASGATEREAVRRTENPTLGESVGDFFRSASSAAKKLVVLAIVGGVLYVSWPLLRAWFARQAKQTKAAPRRARKGLPA